MFRRTLRETLFATFSAMDATANFSFIVFRVILFLPFSLFFFLFVLFFRRFRDTNGVEGVQESLTRRDWGRACVRVVLWKGRVIRIYSSIREPHFKRWNIPALPFDWSSLSLSLFVACAGIYIHFYFLLFLFSLFLFLREQNSRCKILNILKTLSWV